MTCRRWGWLALVAMTAFAGCEGETTITEIDSGPTQLILSPDGVLLNDTDGSSGSFFLSADGPRALDWQVTSQPNWLTITPSSGRISSQVVEIAVEADATGFQPGTYVEDVEIISTGGEVEFPVTLDVDPHPMLDVDVTSVDFNPGTNQQVIQLSNVGTGTLSWTMSSDEAWLQPSPSSGWLASGESSPVALNVSRQGLSANNYDANLTIESNSERGQVQLPVGLEVIEQSILVLDDTSVALGLLENSVSVSISNDGNVPFDWSATSDLGFVDLQPNSGTVGVGASQSVDVVVDRDGLTTGTHEGSIVVTTTDFQESNATVLVEHYQQVHSALAYRIVDAEYDRIDDVIVAVTEEPSLVLLDPETGSSTSVGLSVAATSVAVTPDGTEAAVGHNGFITHVDLESPGVIDTYGVTCDVYDLTITDSGWAYAIPIRDQWERVRCLNLSTGAETLHTGSSIRAASRCVLHPSGDFMYVADRGLSPSDFEKYDLRTGTAIRMYDSPYHGTYSFGGDIWASDDGARLFAASGNVFRSSSTQGDDMTYSGQLAGASPVRDAVHSTAADRILSINSSTPEEIRVYSSEFLSYRGPVALPQWLVPGGSGEGELVDVDAQFVFFNSDGSRYYALLKAHPSAGLLLDWAVFGGEATELP